MAALALGASHGAQAQTVVNGGGSTLAQKVYNGVFSAYSQLVDPTVSFNYAGVGSGAGQRGLLCNDPAQVSGEAAPIAFGASDATLSQAQIDAWNNSTAAANGTSSCITGGGGIGKAQGGPLGQVPTFGTAISIPFNLANQSTQGSIRLNDTQLCGIFSGKITTWNDPALSGINTKGAPPTGTIKVVYRSDGSGTTFLMTQHLAAVCTPATSNITFSAVQTFASLFTTMPSNFVGAPGSGGVQSAIGINAVNTGGAATGNVNSIGYLTPDNTLIATVNTGLKSQFPPVAQVFNTHTGTFVLPSVANTQSALQGGAVPSGADLLNPAKYVPAIPDPTVGYPIVGYTVVIFPTCYADANVGFTVSGVLFELAQADYKNIIQSNGFAALPDALQTVVQQNIVNHGANNIDIENSTICQSAGASGPGTFVGR